MLDRIISNLREMRAAGDTKGVITIGNRVDMLVSGACIDVNLKRTMLRYR